MVFDPPRQNQSAKKQEGGDDVIPYVPVSVSLDKSTSESVDPSVSVSSSRLADLVLFEFMIFPARPSFFRPKQMLR